MVLRGGSSSALSSLDSGNSRGYASATRLLNREPSVDQAETPPGDDDGAPPSIFEKYAAGKLVLDPREHPLLPYWDLLVVLGTIVVSFRVPYKLGFLLKGDFDGTEHRVKDGAAEHFDNVVNFIFMFDMVLQFFISCPDPVNHRWIRMPNVIVKQYLCKYFLIDAVSILPYGKLSRFCRERLSDKWKFLSILKILSLLKLMRVNRLIQRYYSRVAIANSVLKLVKLLVTLALSLHWIACAWGAVLSVEMILDLYDGSTWADSLRVAKPAMFGSETGENSFELYTASLYWSCMTLTSIGYGDITATNPLECWAALMLMGACGIIWANIIGSICAIAGSLDADNVAHETQMDALNNMLAHFKLPDSDRMRLREFFQRRKVLCNRERQVELLHQMSPDLKGIVARHVQSTLLEKVWVFKRCASADGLVVGLFEQFHFTMYPPKELVALPGCFVCVDHGVGLLMAHVMNAGSYWGVSDLVLNNHKLWEGAKCLALSYVELQYLTRDSFARLITQKEYRKQANIIRKDALLFAVQIAVMRRLVAPSFVEEPQSPNGVNHGFSRQVSSRSSSSRTPDEVMKVQRSISKRKTLAAKQRAEHAEAKLSNAMEIVRSGVFSAETCRKADSVLDDLLDALSKDPLVLRRSEQGETQDGESSREFSRSSRGALQDRADSRYSSHSAKVKLKL